MSSNGTKDHVQQETIGKAQIEDASEQLEQIAANLVEKADDARVEIAKQIQSIAENLRKEASERALDDSAREQVEMISSGLDQAADYLDSRTVEEIGEEATDTVRNNPWKAVLAVFIVGLIIGIFLKRR